MLFWGITVLSAAAAVAACLRGGAFGGFSWLWALPLSFAGFWLGLTVLALVFLVIACAVVDKEKEQAHDSAFYRRMAHLYIDFVVTIGRVRIHTQGLEQTPKEGRFLLVCNHQNDIDPAVVLKCFPKSQLAFISKKENKNMPIVGSIMHRIMCQLMDRENDRQALKVILKCIQLIKDDEVSVGVFPEGYCSRDGKLHHMKGGVFKIAQKANAPIVVCTIRDTKKALHKLLRLQPSDVTLHLVGVIGPEELKGVSTVEIGERVYEMMIADMGEEYRCEV